METYLHVYDRVSNSNKKSNEILKSGHDSKMYMVPLKSLQEEEEEKSEYEQPQVSVLSLPKMTLPVYESTTAQHQNDQTEREIAKKKKNPLWFITICVLITVFAVVTLVALAIGALSFNSARQDGTSSTQLGDGAMSGTISEESLNYTHLMNEISALNAFVGQLNSDTHRNFSQLIGQLNSFSLITSNSSLQQFSQQLMVVQNDISSVNEGQRNLQSDVRVAQTSIASVNRQLSTARGDITSVKNKISQ